MTEFLPPIIPAQQRLPDNRTLQTTFRGIHEQLMAAGHEPMLEDARIKQRAITTWKVNMPLYRLVVRQEGTFTNPPTIENCDQRDSEICVMLPNERHEWQDFHYEARKTPKGLVFGDDNLQVFPSEQQAADAKNAMNDFFSHRLPAFTEEAEKRLSVNIGGPFIVAAVVEHTSDSNEYTESQLEVFDSRGEAFGLHALMINDALQVLQYADNRTTDQANHELTAARLEEVVAYSRQGLALLAAAHQRYATVMEPR